MAANVMDGEDEALRSAGMMAHDIAFNIDDQRTKVVEPAYMEARATSAGEWVPVLDAKKTEWEHALNLFTAELRRLGEAAGISSNEYFNASALSRETISSAESTGPAFGNALGGPVTA